jgi:cell division protein FtsQ
MKHFNWYNIRLIVLFGVLVFLYSFSSDRNSHRKLQKSEVVFVGNNNVFVKQEVVNKLLIENKLDARSIEKIEVDLNIIEKSINNHPMIQKSEVFVSVDGVLKALVVQKTPIARVMTQNGSFYIDSEGNTMPLSENYAAHVPLVSGAISKENCAKMYPFLMQIYKDDFLKKNIISVEVLNNKDVLLGNRNYDFDIEFGKLKEIERKFKNYKAFFHKSVADHSIEKYKKITLKFTQQVVCTK